MATPAFAKLLQPLVTPSRFGRELAGECRLVFFEKAVFIFSIEETCAYRDLSKTSMLDSTIPSIRHT